MSEVVLIGSGSSVLDTPLGKTIDSFPIVARVNRFRLNGYSEYTGTKTDIWFVSDYMFRWYNKYKPAEIIFVSPGRPPNQRFNGFQERIPYSKLYPRKYYEQVRKMSGYMQPSSGILAAYYLSQFYDKIYLLGIDGFNGDGTEYWSEVNIRGRHRTDKELMFLEQLYSTRKVKLLNNYTYLHDHQASYGTGGCFAKKILAYKPESILDYGCGKGGLVKWLNKKVPTNGYDPYVFEYRTKPIGTFDMLVSTDFLEHIEENKLNDVLSDMQNFQPRLMFHAISNRKAAQILPDGTNAHKNVKPSEWWESKLIGKFSDYTVKILEHNDRNNFTTYLLEKENGHGNIKN